MKSSKDPQFSKQKSLLSQRQQELLSFLESEVQAKGVMPSMREMAKALQVSAVGTVQDHMAALQKAGFAEKSENERTWRLVRLPWQDQRAVSKVPILGRVAAGALMEAIEDPQGYLYIEEKKRSAQLFALRVQGQSMIEAGIFPEDLVIVDMNLSVHDGDIVVVDYEGDVTLKEIYFPKRKSTMIELRPRNSKMQPILIPANERFRVLGKVVRLERRF